MLWCPHLVGRLLRVGVRSLISWPRPQAIAIKHTHTQSSFSIFYFTFKSFSFHLDGRLEGRDGDKWRREILHGVVIIKNDNLWCWIECRGCRLLSTAEFFHLNCFRHAPSFGRNLIKPSCEIILVLFFYGNHKPSRNE